MTTSAEKSDPAELRPITADDLEPILALHNRCLVHDGVEQSFEMGELREELDDDGVTFADDVRVAIVDGDIVGYAYALNLPSDVREERCYVFGRVDPPFRRRGVRTQLMHWAVPRAAARLISSGNDLPKWIRAFEYDTIESAHALYRMMGFEPVRYEEELLRPVENPPEIQTIDGIRIVAWTEDRDEEARIVKNTSFADHWGSTPTTVDHWHHRVRGFAGRPDLSLLALDDEDRVVACCVIHRYEADDELLGRKEAWIDTLGTLREWRGRGIASAFIAQSLHNFAADGLSHAAIGVDSENPTGASELYRKLGFEPQRRVVVSQLAADKVSSPDDSAAAE